MIYFKSCTRCEGDVYVTDDTYGTFLTCLQCGFSRDQQTLPERKQSTEACQSDFEVALRAKKAS